MKQYASNKVPPTRPPFRASTMASRTWHPISPLIAFNDPRDVFAAQPTFLFAECAFLLLAIVGLMDAAKRPRGMLNKSGLRLLHASGELSRRVL